jgi:mannose-6-phosphate isomerase
MFVELCEMRVYRPFVGGKLLDEFCGSKQMKEGHFPERWICSTTSSSDGTGLSKTVEGQTLLSLVQEPLDILVKLIDSYTRLMIQVHPDKARAEAYFHYPSGKTECWYVLGTRQIDGVDPFVFVGFKEGVTRKQWETVFEQQDISAMEACLHRIPVSTGDAFYIPAGVPHAMGSGVFFAEVQEPSDITLRTEWKSPDNRQMEAFDLHHGAGFEAMFSCFDYEGLSLPDTLKRFKSPRVKEKVVDVPSFSLEDWTIGSSYTISPNRFAIVIVLEGKDKGKEFFCDEPHTFTGPSRILVCYGAGR